MSDKHTGNCLALKRQLLHRPQEGGDRAAPEHSNFHTWPPEEQLWCLSTYRAARSPESPVKTQVCSSPVLTKALVKGHFEGMHALGWSTQS